MGYTKYNLCNLLLEYYTNKASVKLWDKYVTLNSNGIISEHVYEQFYNTCIGWVWENGKMIDTANNNKEVVFNFTEGV